MAAKNKGSSLVGSPAITAIAWLGIPIGWLMVLKRTSVPLGWAVLAVSVPVAIAQWADGIRDLLSEIY